MDNDWFRLFLAIGACHGILKEHAREARRHPEVSNVTHWLDVHDLGGAFRLEEFVDVELANGEAICWCLELTLSPGVFAVESDVRRIHRAGQDLIEEVADCTYPTAEECATGILEFTRRLCVINPV